jgi:protein-disulfide isomerase
MRKESVIVWGITIAVLGAVVFGIYKTSGTNPNQLTLSEPVSASDHVRGDPNAKAILLEYSDYQCPACAQYEILLQKLLTDESVKVKIIYRNFPLSQHANALPSAYAAEASGLQGKFWEMHDMIFAHQADWSNSTTSADIFLGYAKVIGLNIAQYQKDISSPQIAERVAHDRATGEASNIIGTPTFFLNSKSITVNSYDQLKQLIETASQ